MSFIPTVERPHLGKKIYHPAAVSRQADFLIHDDSVRNQVTHTGKRVIGIPRPIRLDDEIAKERKAMRPVDDSEIFRSTKLDETPTEIRKAQLRSKTSMEKVDYQPLDAKVDGQAARFANLETQLSIMRLGRPEPSHRPGLRLAPLPALPPPQCAIPGFQGMGNPYYYPPNERPNQAAATKTNAVLGKQVPFYGERKNNAWSVYVEPPTTS